MTPTSLSPCIDKCRSMTDTDLISRDVNMTVAGRKQPRDRRGHGVAHGVLGSKAIDGRPLLQRSGRIGSLILARRDRRLLGRLTGQHARPAPVAHRDLARLGL